MIGRFRSTSGRVKLVLSTVLEQVKVGLENNETETEPVTPEEWGVKVRLRRREGF